MDRVVIRPAVVSDVALIRGLQEQWAEENITYGFAAEGEEQIRQRLSGPYVLVAEVGGRVVGFASGQTRVSEGMAVAPEGITYLDVDNLYVARLHRRNKVGGLLMEGLLEVARREGVGKVVVYSASRDARRILRFYEGHGFRSWYIWTYQDL